MIAALIRAIAFRRAQKEVKRCADEREMILQCLEDYHKRLRRAEAAESLARHKLWSL